MPDWCSCESSRVCTLEDACPWPMTASSNCTESMAGAIGETNFLIYTCCTCAYFLSFAIYFRVEARRFGVLQASSHRGRMSISNTKRSQEAILALAHHPVHSAVVRATLFLDGLMFASPRVTLMHGFSFINVLASLAFVDIHGMSGDRYPYWVSSFLQKLMYVIYIAIAAIFTYSMISVLANSQMASSRLRRLQQRSKCAVRVIIFLALANSMVSFPASLPIAPTLRARGAWNGPALGVQYCINALLIFAIGATALSAGGTVVREINRQPDWWHHGCIFRMKMGCFVLVCFVGVAACIRQALVFCFGHEVVLMSNDKLTCMTWKNPHGFMLVTLDILGSILYKNGCLDGCLGAPADRRSSLAGRASAERRSAERRSSSSSTDSPNKPTAEMVTKNQNPAKIPIADVIMTTNPMFD